MDFGLQNFVRNIATSVETEITLVWFSSSTQEFVMTNVSKRMFKICIFQVTELFAKELFRVV